MPPARKKDTPEDTGNKLEALKPGDHNPYAHGLLEQARDLREEKDQLFVRIAANREALRQARTTGFVSDDQAKAIEEWYPTPKRGEKKGEAENNGAGDSSPDAPTGDTPADPAAANA